MVTLLLVGTDISDRWFDACFSSKPNAPVTRYPNHSQGHADFIKAAKKLGKKVWVCMEHTGGCETDFAMACKKAGFTVSVIDGRKFSRYKKSFGSAIAKTDQVDARYLAKFCDERKPAEWNPFPDEYLTLRELVKHRDELIEHRKRASCQASHAPRTEFVEQQRRALLEILSLQIEAADQEISAHLQSCPKLLHEVELLESIPGIAKKSAVKILSETGPISNYSSAKSYALAAGLSPIVSQSGKKTPPGKLPTYGNKNLRKALYFPAVVTFRKHKGVGPFMERIEKNGNKAKMTLIVAGMRKLAHVVYGVLKNQTKFDQAIISKAT